MKRTKWEILQAHKDKAHQEYHRLNHKMASLEQTPFADGTISCSTCGVPLPTEATFAQHYIVDDERYLNLGNCPTRYNNGVLMPALNRGSWGYGRRTLEEEAYEVNERWWEAMLEDAYMTNAERDQKRETDHARAHNWER